MRTPAKTRAKIRGLPARLAFIGGSSRTRLQVSREIARRQERETPAKARNAETKREDARARERQSETRARPKQERGETRPFHFTFRVALLYCSVLIIIRLPLF